MIRTIKVERITAAGINIQVSFTGQPCITWPDIRTPFSSYSPGQNGVFVTVTSPPFHTVEEANGWIDELTAEVKALAEIDEGTIETFKKLESTIEI